MKPNRVEYTEQSQIAADGTEATHTTTERHHYEPATFAQVLKLVTVLCITLVAIVFIVLGFKYMGSFFALVVLILAFMGGMMYSFKD